MDRIVVGQVVALLFGATVACGGGGGAEEEPERWRPAPGTSWQWQLSGEIDTGVDAEVFDIDLFEAPAGVIEDLHRDGRRVVCYLDTAYEPDRPDSERLAPYRKNPVEGWPGQYWLDVREPEVVDVMLDRIALAAERECDAVEPDDVDARSNDPGYPLTAAEQQDFIRILAGATHAHGMSVALKNDLDEVDELLADVDFAINEECFAFDECGALDAFIAADKAVFQVEYTEGDLDALADEICPQARARGFDTLIKHLDLGAARRACR